MKRDPKLNPELSASSVRHVCGDHFDCAEKGYSREVKVALKRQVMIGYAFIKVDNATQTSTSIGNYRPFPTRESPEDAWDEIWAVEYPDNSY
ncbi:hypothetical protein AVEN_154196-1 [Araneus ventricosus]|uniref:Uncharacterized protein n=1 Tax=Araneus ventricosus TaxID=182803 RepID=A0A4Y2UD15_ARAVE|nr:hypothetical protein AVEN_154196-1 [Araneus ventricosus]